MKNETLVDSRMHYTYNDPAFPQGRYIRNETYRHLLVGDIVVRDVAAPGTGRVTYRITRTDETGAWGVIESSTVRELTTGDVR